MHSQMSSLLPLNIKLIFTCKKSQNYKEMQTDDS